METEYVTVKKTWWLRRIHHLILKNLSEFDLTNTTLAEELSMSERQLYRIVKELTGLSPNVYIRQIRLREAYQLLQTEKYLSVREVAALVGYQKSEYFIRLFIEKYGVHPIKILKEDKDE